MPQICVQIFSTDRIYYISTPWYCNNETNLHSSCLFRIKQKREEIQNTNKRHSFKYYIQVGKKTKKPNCQTESNRKNWSITNSFETELKQLGSVHDYRFGSVRFLKGPNIRFGLVFYIFFKVSYGSVQNHKTKPF
jgi:hypothetical protein